MKNWVEKHRPKSFLEIKGQKEALEKVKSFITSFNLKKISKNKTQKKAIVLYGGPGIGKTTLAHVVAKETNSEIFELNASDLRNKTKLEETLKPAIEQKSLIKKGKIILIDEADGITGTDRGGIPEIKKIIEKTEFPIIVTANDIWLKKLSPLRKQCEMIQLNDLDYHTVKEVLINILKKEKKFIDNQILTNISVKCKGDLRAAINDLQTISKLENPSKANINERNKEIDIFNALKKIFKLKPTTETLKIFDSVNMSIDEIILWVEKNIPKEYTGKELARAYELLSKVDLFKGRIYKQQYWRFLVYENIFLSYGISSVKKQDKISNNYTTYKKPTRILKIWMNNIKTAKKKTIAEKYANKTHISIKKAMKEFSIIRTLINSNEKISEELKLDEDEIAYLKNLS